MKTIQELLAVQPESRFNKALLPYTGKSAERDNWLFEIVTAADFYHSMEDEGAEYWHHNFWAALDILERVLGIEEGSLLIAWLADDRAIA